MSSTSSATLKNVFRRHRYYAAAALTSFGATVVGITSLEEDSSFLFFDHRPSQCEKVSPSSPSVRRSSLYTSDQVAQRNGEGSAETWVTFQGKVYNVTDFIKDHPGGSLIKDAAGRPIEPFWAYWAYHSKLERPLATLQLYEIGTLIEEDDENDDDDESQSLLSMQQEFYRNDPNRTESKAQGQIELLDYPWCSETDPSKMQTYLTPSQAFYVRNHAPVPEFDDTDESSIADYSISLQLGGTTSTEQETSTHGTTSAQPPPIADPSTVDISLKSLQLGTKYPIVTITSTLQCAGNRAKEQIAIAPTAFSTTPFREINTGMMGNATWTGVRLRDVLKDAFDSMGHRHEQYKGYHLEVEGLDGYMTSIPLERVLDPEMDVLLCWKMNGSPLLPDHGYPLRILIPGVAGARSVKWVHSMRLQPKESSSCFTKTYYKDMYGRAIQELPLQAFLTSKTIILPPEEEKAEDQSTVLVTGVAWGGGSGVGISHVDVSIDEGVTWERAILLDRTLPASSSDDINVETDSSHREWTWDLFEASLKVATKDPASVTVLCRATDKNGLSQPEKIWYPKGYLYNGWHRL